MSRSWMFCCLAAAACGPWAVPDRSSDAGLPSPSLDGGDPCAIVSATSADLGNVNQIAPSWDGKQYLENKKDDGGTFQVFVAATGSDALVCITCAQNATSPAPGKHKLMAEFTPDSAWVTLGVEMDNAPWPPFCDDGCKQGLLMSGINIDMWAVSSDGAQWVKLKQFDPTQPSQGAGFTGPAFRPGTHEAYWAMIVDGDIFVYGFGKWRLMRSTLAFAADGTPSLTDTTDVTPAGASWVEPGNFTPDGRSLLLSSDIGLPTTATFGQDQWALDVTSGAVTNLTHSPAWDEHGLYSPDGKKVVWMSSQPYPSSTWVGNLQTDFLLMDADGSNVRQLTHFNQPGDPESSDAGSVAAVAVWSADGRSLQATQQTALATQKLWTFGFAGACGLSP